MGFAVGLVRNEALFLQDADDGRDGVICRLGVIIRFSPYNFFATPPEYSIFCPVSGYPPLHIRNLGYLPHHLTTAVQLLPIFYCRIMETGLFTSRGG